MKSGHDAVGSSSDEQARVLDVSWKTRWLVPHSASWFARLLACQSALCGSRQTRWQRASAGVRSMEARAIFGRTRLLLRVPPVYLSLPLAMAGSSRNEARSKIRQQASEDDNNE